MATERTGRCLLAALLASGLRALLPAVVALLSGPAFGQGSDGEVAEGSGVLYETVEGPTPTGAAPDEVAGPPVSAAGLGRAIAPPEGAPEGLGGALPGFERALAAYEAEIGDYNETISRVVEVEYRYRRREIGAFYDGEIDTLREGERGRRAEAVAQFELFLERYPSDPSYTPDVMFRLAELHYEVALDAYIAADRDYERQMVRYQRGIEPFAPEPPRKDFSRAVAVFEDLIRRFPEYRQIDGAYYLLSICQEEMDRYDEALASLQTLVTQYPTSAFAQESWLRIGEVYFDGSEFELARTAYDRAYSFGESKWYDKILFKLGWATYLLGEFDTAIGRFGDLLTYYDRIGDSSVQALREEAVQYFAVSVAEEDWDIDGARDADFLLPRLRQYLGDPSISWRPEVLDRLAALLMDIERYEYAIQVYELLLTEHPLDRQNPWRHEKIVLAWNYLRDTDRAFEEQRRLAQLYAPGTAWYAEQERLGNSEALAYAQALAREGLLQSANFYYVQAEGLATQASQTGDATIEGQAIEAYRFAARLYGQFLEQYPNVDEAYETRMYYAQALMYATAFENAGEQFEQVRDSELSDEFRVASASLAIVCYESALRREIDAGRLEPRAWPGHPLAQVRDAPVPGDEEEESQEAEEGESRTEQARTVVTAEPLPELSTRWLAAIDAYAAMGLEDPEAPDRGIQNLFAVGKLFYDYGDYEPARERFVLVLDACRPINETAYAAAFLIESYAATDDTDALRFWSQELDRRAACVPVELRELLAADLDRLAMGELAQRAEELMNEGRFAEAAEEYARLAAEYADNPETAPLGLYNSGLIYEQNLRQYERAMEQFNNLVRLYPESEWVDRSLVRIAVNAKKFFDFDQAIATFQTLDERGFSDATLVEYPLLDAAELLEYSQRYEEAARSFIEFVDRYPSDSRASAVLYKAGTLYGLAGMQGEMLETFERFRSDYGRSASTALLDVDAAYIDTLYRTAKHYEEQGNARLAQRFFEQVVSEFDVRRPDAAEAKYAAAEVLYGRAMAAYERWTTIELGTTVSQQRAGITRRTDGIPAVLEAFDQASTYGSADWTVCAFYMRGQVYQDFADLLIGLPMPDFGGNLDAEDEYMIMLTDLTTPIEDAAIREWEIAYPVMQQLGVVNQCTLDTTRQLNRVRGDQYPLQQQPIVHEELRLFTPHFVSLPAATVEEGTGPATIGPAEDPFGEGP